MAPVQLLELLLAAFHAASALFEAQLHAAHPDGSETHLEEAVTVLIFDKMQY